jgi:hypothetical protein
MSFDFDVEMKRHANCTTRFASQQPCVRICVAEFLPLLIKVHVIDLSNISFSIFDFVEASKSHIHL